LTVLAGVLGFPVAHSRSPAMMNAAFAELGLDWRYLRLPVPPARFAETVAALGGSGYLGANVTIPHKVAAHDLAHELTPAAAAIGAVNTLVFEADGRMLGDNTDAPGLIDALGDDLRGRRALVLGAGGTGRAAVWALSEAGAEVAVWNRTAERAAALARELGARHALRVEPADVLVNTTSLGLRGEDLPAEVGLDGIEPRLVADVVYGEERTALARWGEARGARVVDGLEMLVRQGARSLERWTGLTAPIDAMRRGVLDV
jgi:shikimate dehydrogenase